MMNHHSNRMYFEKTFECGSASESSCLAAVNALRNFRSIVLGARLMICTNHNALAWLMRLEDECGRLLRWLLEIQEFEY